MNAALSMLRLHPLHEALRAALSAENVQALVAMAEGLAAPADGKSAKDSSTNATEVRKNPWPENSWSQALSKQCEAFFARVSAHLPVEDLKLATRLRSAYPEDDAAEGYQARCETLTADVISLSRIARSLAEGSPVMSLLLPHADADWALIAAWAVLGGLPWRHEGPEVFDRLRLRPALTEIFHSFGLEGDDAWRAAAKMRVLLLNAASLETHEFWNDGDVRWLAGVNEADGVAYVNRERYEDLIDWLQTPNLLEIAAQSADPAPPLLEIEATVNRAREAAAEAGYRLERILSLTSEMSRSEVEPGTPAPLSVDAGKSGD